MSSAHFFSTAALRRGQQFAVQQGSRQASFAELDARSTALAWGFIELGLAEGDCVALQMHMCVEFAQIECALHKAALGKIGISPLASLEEAGSKVKSKKARAFIIDTGSCDYTAATFGFESVTVFISTDKPVEGYVEYDDLIRQHTCRPGSGGGKRRVKRFL